jgi:hypothetical protein
MHALTHGRTHKLRASPTTKNIPKPALQAAGERQKQAADVKSKRQHTYRLMRSRPLLLPSPRYFRTIAPGAPNSGRAAKTSRQRKAKETTHLSTQVDDVHSAADIVNLQEIAVKTTGTTGAAGRYFSRYHVLQTDHTGAPSSARAAKRVTHVSERDNTPIDSR